MKQSRDLRDLAAELVRINETKKDFLVPLNKMVMSAEGQLTFTNGTTEKFNMNGWASGQLASYTDIPKAYYDRLNGENKALLASNVNHGFQRQIAENKNLMPTRMVRTLDGKVRAFLSNSYRRLDGYDLLNNVLPMMLDRKMKVISAEITEQRMYIKAVTDQLMADVKQGDTVQYGLVISSSDVGGGSVKVEPFLNRLVCTNGLILPHTLRTSHLTGRQQAAEVEELFTDQTKELENNAYWSKVRDVVTATLSDNYFEQAVEKLRVTAEDKITNFDLIKVVEMTNKAINSNLNEKAKQDIVAALANGNEGAGLTRWGLINAFTRGAESEHLDYDESVNLERSASKIIELAPKMWKEIAHA
jgi:hypothetical protein